MFFGNRQFKGKKQGGKADDKNEIQAGLDGNASTFGNLPIHF